jgi:purine nucleosidase
VKHTIIIDSDPGQDDAVAIMLALAAQAQLKVLGITAVAGNVSVEQTTTNILRVCDLIGRGDVPVFKGAAQPILYPLETAEFVCGPDGLAGANLAPTVRAAEPGHAVDFIIRQLRSAPDDSVTLCPLGPLTNIALAIRLAPDSLSKIKQFVLMGGALALGNMTPAAEFNFYVDPHAAAITFTAGRPIVMFGLNVTHQAICNAQQIAALKTLGTATGQAIHGMLTRERAAGLGTSGHPLHDACVIAYLLWPELFTGRDCFVAIETNDGPLRGRSTIDWNGRLKRTSNAFVVDAVQGHTLFDRMTRMLAQLP